MALTRNDRLFMQRLLRRIGNAALRVARPKVRNASRTLASAMRFVANRRTARRGAFTGAVHIPHYWAIYVHDGRRPFRKQKVMVFWRNPENDPRRQPSGRTPQRRANLRRLSREEYARAVMARQAWLDAGGDPYDSPVIITKQIRKGTPPTPFFSNEAGGGMQNFGVQAGRIARAEFSRHVRATLGDKLKETDEATVRL